MLKVIGGNQVDITEQEFEYYKYLSSQYSVEIFNDLFSTDQDGIITRIAPISPTPWVILFFVQNVMINQHLGSTNRRLDDMTKKFDEIASQIRRLKRK